MLGLILPTLAVSAGIVITAWRAAPREANRDGLRWMMAIAFLLAMSLSVVLFLHFAVMMVLLIIWAIFGRRPKMLRTFALVAPIWPYAWGFSQAMHDRDKVAELRAKYPVVSLTDRLAYEKPPVKRATDQAVAGKSYSSVVLADLAEQEERHESRQYQDLVFRHLHDETYDRFVGSPGFGPARMARMPLNDPRVEPPKSIDQPEVATPSSDRSTPDTGAVVALQPAEQRPPMPARFMLDALHKRGATNFVESSRIGYVENRDHVVGFEPHRFDSVPDFRGAGDDDWRVAKLELVSLLKHAEPCVYVSTHLPRMDELKDAPTRPLDSFEARSLPQLRTESDTVTEIRTNTVRMLGAVRAGKTCLQCHNVERGDLLGAFSYVLRRAVPIVEPKPAKSKPPA